MFSIKKCTAKDLWNRESFSGCVPLLMQMCLSHQINDKWLLQVGWGSMTQRGWRGGCYFSSLPRTSRAICQLSPGGAQRSDVQAALSADGAVGVNGGAPPQTSSFLLHPCPFPCFELHLSGLWGCDCLWVLSVEFWGVFWGVMRSFFVVDGVQTSVAPSSLKSEF